MTDPAAALATQLANIEKRTGKSLGELARMVKASGLAKHGEIRDLLKRELGLGYGDANTLTHHVLAGSRPDAAGADPSFGDIVDGWYAGSKAALRPIHDRLMQEVGAFGPFQIAPKKTYVSLRRSRQFAMIGPATNTRVEVGLNIKGLPPHERLVAMPPKSMCDLVVKLTDVAQVDAALIGWIRRAYDAAT